MAKNPDKDEETQQQNAPLAGQHDPNDDGKQQDPGFDEVLQANLGQGDLAQQDALTQQNDDGMGEAAGEEEGR